MNVIVVKVHLAGRAQSHYFEYLGRWIGNSSCEEGLAQFSDLLSDKDAQVEVNKHKSLIDFAVSNVVIFDVVVDDAKHVVDPEGFSQLAYVHLLELLGLLTGDSMADDGF